MGEMLDNVAWYGRRLRAMSSREVAERVSRSVRHRVDAVEYHAAPRAWRSRWHPPVATILRESPHEVPLGFIEAARAAGLGKRLPEAAERLVERATTALEGRFRFFGYPEAIVSERGADIDPFTGLAWPRRHAKRVDYRRGEVGDPKWIWELNRCQDLPLLAAASALTGQAHYAAAAGDRMEQWIVGHPPGRGIAWSSGFEAGIRAISLAVTMDALRGSPHLSRARAEKTLVSLWQHARWIEGDPSNGSSANNHRIGELVGLVVIACFAPELVDSARFLDLGLCELEREADLQIRADGTSVEQSFAYHVVVLDLLVVAAGALDVAGHPVPSGIYGALERSGDALWAQVADGEPEPTYGDSDESRALVLDGEERRSGRSVASAIAACLGHARAARVAGGLDATAWWLFGQEGATRFDRVQPAAAPGSSILPDGGMTILRRNGVRATLDHGPHGYLRIAAHGHADALRVDVSLGSHELVVDPGVGSYLGRPAVRAAFRSTALHPTVTVDGVSSSVSGGPFLWSRHARSRLLSADVGDGIIIAEHDGYMRLQDPVLHRRALVLVDDAVLVVDRLEARAAHLYSQRWPLHPELALVELGDDRIVSRGPDVGLVIVVAATQAARLMTVRGNEEPFGGWWSERLESIEPSWLVAGEVHAAGVLEIASLMVPFASKAAPEVELRIEARDHGTRVEVATACGKSSLELELVSSEPEVRRLAEARAR